MRRIISISFCLIIYINLAAQIEVGDKAPNFETESVNGENWALNTALANGPVVLYFYPAAMTGGCTKQACAYRDNKMHFDQLGVTVVGISGDNIKNLQLFKRHNNLNFELLSDSTGTVAQQYGVTLSGGGKIKREIEEKSYELVRQVTSARWTFIINSDGRVLYKNTHVDAATDYKSVLEILSKLK